MSEMADAIRALSAEKGIDEDSIRQTIERMITATYQKSFGKGYTNCIVTFSDDIGRKNCSDGSAGAGEYFQTAADPDGGRLLYSLA